MAPPVTMHFWVGSHFLFGCSSHFLYNFDTLFGTEFQTQVFQFEYLQPIITQYFIDNKSEIWLLFLIAHSKR